jgi:hypothetical protein
MILKMDFEVNEEGYVQTKWLIRDLRPVIMLETLALKLQRESY